MAAIDNLVHERTTTTGTGDLTLTPRTGWRRFSVVFGTGVTLDVFFYAIRQHESLEWEVGTGHMSDATTLVRDTVVASSNSDALVDFSAGTKDMVNDLDKVTLDALIAGPGSAVDENLAVFDSTTGKLIKDGLINKSAVTANTAKVTNATHSGDATGATALTIANNAVDNVKAADMATKTMKGRTSALTGDPEDLTAAQARAILNVADGADVTGDNAPQAHAASHQNAGSDEISVAGLSGKLADAQTPLGHAASHVDGSDDIQDASNAQKGVATAAQIQALEAVAAKVDLIAEVTREPGGFTAPEDVIVTGDSTSRTVTLTGTVAAYYLGVLNTTIVSGWTSDAHGVDTTKGYMLTYDGSTIEWHEASTLPADFFDQLLISFAFYNNEDATWIYLRECHGLEPWESHRNEHFTIGTYKRSGGVLGDYVIDSETAADRRPSVAASSIFDEDLQTTVTALALNGPYTNYTLTGAAGVYDFDTSAVEIIPVVGAVPYWNEFTGGSWGQTAFSDKDSGSVWLMAVPMAADADSQNARLLWMQPQSVGKEKDILAQTPNDVNLTVLDNLLPELVFIAQIIVEYKGGDWNIAHVISLDGTRHSQTSSPAGNYLTAVVDDTTPASGGTFDTNAHDILTSEGAAVASASADIWAGADGDTVHITGTTEIDTLGTAGKIGASKRVIFDGILNIVHSANIDLPGDADYTTAAGDWGIVYAQTTTTFRVMLFKADGTAVVGGGATIAGVQNSTYTFAADAEASDAYAITLAPAIAAYATGQEFTFTATTANTGAATLDVNGKGAKTIKKRHDVDLADGDIEAGQAVTVFCDGTNFQMLSQVAAASASSSTFLLPFWFPAGQYDPLGDFAVLGEEAGADNAAPLYAVGFEDTGTEYWYKNIPLPPGAKATGAIYFDLRGHAETPAANKVVKFTMEYDSVAVGEDWDNAYALSISSAEVAVDATQDKTVQAQLNSAPSTVTALSMTGSDWLYTRIKRINAGLTGTNLTDAFYVHGVLMLVECEAVT